MKKIEGYPAWCWWSKWFWALVVKPGQMSEKSLFSPGTSWFESKTSTPTYPRNGSRCDCSAPPYFKFNNKKSSNTKMVQLSPDQHVDAWKSTLLTGCCRSISGSKSYSQSSLPPQASNLHICDLKLLPSIIKSTSPITINIMTMSPVIIVDKFPKVLFGDVSQPCHSCCRQGLLHNL